MKTTAVIAALLAGQLLFSAEPKALSPETALGWLKFGNERHQSGRYIHWHQSVERRKQVASRQSTSAVVLTCSDSQVPPEILFDQGLGDLFVVRVAGNTAGEKELASIEHGANRLRAPLVVVLGHQDCGVVQDAVGGTPVKGSAGSIMAALAPAVERSRGLSGNHVDNAVRANVDAVVRQLAASPALGHLAASRRLKVVGGYYSSHTGAVQWLGEGSVSAPQPAVTSQRH